MANVYSALQVLVEANTRPMEAQIRSSATKAGEEASTAVGGHFSRGLAKVAPIAGAVGKSVATGLGLATTAAVAFGVHAFKAASSVTAMDASLRALAKANGVSYSAMQQSIGALQRQGFAVSDAQKLVGDLTREHIGLAHATELGRLAQNASIVTGRDVASTESAITKAIATGNASALKRAGIYVDTKTVLDKYAASLGTTSANLTATQKSQATLDAVLKAGGPIAGAWAAQLKTPQGAMRAMKLQAEELTVTVGTGLVKALGPAFTAAAKLGRAFTEAAAPGGKLAPIISAIGTTAARMAAPLAGLINKLTLWIDKLNPAKVQRIVDVIKHFGPALLGIGAASAVFTGAGLAGNIPIVGGMLTKLLGPLALLKDGFLSIGKAAIGQLIPGLKGVVGEAEGLGKALGAAAGPVGIILTIFAVLMTVSPQFRQAVMGLAKALLVALMPAFMALLDALKPLLPVLKLLGDMLAQTLAPVIIALMPLLVSLMPLIVALAKIVAALVTVVLALVTPILNVYIAFQKWYEAKILLPLINALVGVLTDLVGIITSVVKWIMGGSPGLVPAFRTLEHVVLSVTATIRDAVVTGFTAIRNAIVRAWQVVSNVSVNTWQTIRGIVVSGMRFLESVVTSGMGTLRSLISKGWAAAVSIVRNAASALGSAGRSAVLALLGGIRAQMAGIAGWVKGNIVNPVVNAVKNFFGIHSPSEVMADVGKNVTAGFVKGIVEGNPLAVAKRIFGGIPSALGAIVGKGMVQVSALPGRALKAISGLGGSIGRLLTKIPGIFGFLGGGSSGGGTGQYAGIMRAVLAHFGIPQLFGTFMAQMMTESGGNKNAINLWDSNAKAGIPSQGLMQVIPPTFAAYAGPYRSRGILDPLANIYSAVAYALSRYGSSIGAVLGHGHGYAAGGILMEPVAGFGLHSGQPYSFGENAPRVPEAWSPLTGAGPQVSRSQAVVVNVFPQQGQSEVAIAAAVSRRLGWAAMTGRA